MSAAHRLSHHSVDQAEPLEILGSEFQRLGRRRRHGRITPENGGAALGADHAVNRVLKHQHPIRRRQGDGPARAALAKDGGDDGHRRRWYRSRSGHP